MPLTLSPALRWGLVAVVTAAVLTPSVLHRALPAAAGDTSPADLADRARASTDRGWSGEVHTVGTLAVPEVDDFAGVSKLFGQSTDLRVWWRGPEHWRVDQVRQSGEADLVRRGDRVLKWTYESRRASVTRYSQVRLPYVADVLPTTTAARLLAGADDDDLAPLPARRVDGRSAQGFRYTVSDPRSSLSRVDVWSDEGTGVPLRVEVYADGSATPVLTTETSAYDPGRPPAERTDFDFPADQRVRTSYALDEAAGANAFAPLEPPSRLAGLQRGGDKHGAVGVYGRGATAFVLVPLRRKIAADVYRQLSAAPGAVSDDDGVTLRVGPLAVRLTGDRRAAYLLTGTVTDAVLDRVGADLRRTPVEYRERR